MEPVCFVEDLSCHCNCYEGTEQECKDEILNLIENYGHDSSRYVVRYTRFD